MVFEMINQLCNHYLSITPIALLDMLVEDFFDLYVDCTNYKILNRDEKGENEYVNKITKPMPIKNGGWF